MKKRASMFGAAVALVALNASIGATTAEAQTFKLAFYNIKSGMGEQGFPGSPVLFASTSNCTDLSKPLNAWGVGFVQAELTAAIANDPKVVALGLAEAWTCAAPAAVQQTLGFRAHTDERNGLAIVARHGFSGPERWLQLDTSLLVNPLDTKWVVAVPVCLDAACSESVEMFAAHWGGVTTLPADVYPLLETHAQQTKDWMEQLPTGEPRVLLGDLNAFEGTAQVCTEGPANAAPRQLRAAGYLDAWRTVFGSAEGYTATWNRAGCGTPTGYLFKRIDYAWSKATAPLAARRFGMVTAGQPAPSDHAGIIAEYPIPGSLLGTLLPTVAVTSPSENATTSGATSVQVTATDDRGVARVELLVDGVTMAVDSTAPYQFTWDTRAVTNSAHVLRAAATDVSGNRTLSPPRTVIVDNPIFPGDETVLHGVEAEIVGGGWRLIADTSAASGFRLQNTEAGVAPPPSAAASPATFVEFTFSANAGKPYRLWVRGRATGDLAANDSVFVQFDGSVNAAGSPVYRIGTTQSLPLTLEECNGCGLSGWGWRDGGMPLDVIGPPIYFSATGLQRIRIQAREDGLGIDQVVLSAVTYRWASPGTPKNDTKILPSTSGPPPANRPPTVTMTSPTNGAAFGAPATIALAATATDSDGSIVRVEFYAGTTLIGSDTTSPYNATWSNVVSGSYNLTARAIDNMGAATVSAGVAIVVSTGIALPAPWVQQDIGSVGQAGTATVSAGRWTVEGAGSDIWGTSDQFHFVYQPLIGDGTIVARVATLENVNPWTKAGVMIRANTAVGAAYAFMLVTPTSEKGIAFQRRTATGALSTHTSGGGIAPPTWVRLTRSGATISAYRSSDGVSWTLVGSDTIVMGATVQVGLAVTSHVPGTLATATFESVSVSATTTPLPAPWLQQDIGSVGQAGTATVSAGRWTVEGAGSDIWGTSDQFHFVYQPLTGDGTIVARLATLENVNPWTKAGVMIRASTAVGAAHAFMLVTPSSEKGLAFQRRTATGALSTHTSGGSLGPPAWVRLTRSGNTISAYRSSDGVSWTLVGSDSIVMGATVQVGLAVTSHVYGTLATATFESVSVAGD